MEKDEELKEVDEAQEEGKGLEEEEQKEKNRREKAGRVDNKEKELKSFMNVLRSCKCNLLFPCLYTFMNRSQMQECAIITNLCILN